MPRFRPDVATCQKLADQPKMILEGYRVDDYGPGRPERDVATPAWDAEIWHKYTPSGDAHDSTVSPGWLTEAIGLGTSNLGRLYALLLYPDAGTNLEDVSVAISHERQRIGTMIDELAKM